MGQVLLKSLGLRGRQKLPGGRVGRCMLAEVVCC